MTLPIALMTGCQTIAFEGINPSEAQVQGRVNPALEHTICKVLGGPIRWSRNDTSETVNQIEILHNAQWVEFGCDKGV